MPYLLPEEDWTEEYIIYLLQYAEKCGDSLAQQFTQNQERQELLELREIFVNVASSDLKYMVFQNIIEEYRKEILWKSSLSV